MKDFQYSFQKLEVWQESRQLVKIVYLLSQGFPDIERYGLTSQVRRACISVASNISEGSGRKLKNDQQRFYDIAYSSLMEVVNQLILANDLEYLEDVELEDNLLPRCRSISAKLYALKER